MHGLYSASFREGRAKGEMPPLSESPWSLQVKIALPVLVQSCCSERPENKGSANPCVVVLYIQGKSDLRKSQVFWGQAKPPENLYIIKAQQHMSGVALPLFSDLSEQPSRCKQ